MTSARDGGGRAAVFVDRDGTLNRELPRPVVRPADLELIDGAAAALARLTDAGFALVVVSNQSAIARGELDFERLARVHEHLDALLAEAGARVELYLACPHHDAEGAPPYRRDCPCRKPRPGMLVEAAARLSLDLARSWIVGDAARDLAAGAAVGVRGILVATGKGEAEFARLSAAGKPPAFERDLAGAAERILAGR